MVSGLRAERRADGSVLVARDRVPGSDEIEALELPQRLGGGYLFVTRGQGTSLWRAATWTAPLEPLATLELRAERIEPGFDRLYVLGRRETRALDVESGETMSLGALPVASTYRELRFGPGWTALAEVPIAGVLATFDGGQQWWPLTEAKSVLAEDSGLYVAMDRGIAELGTDGTLRLVEQIDEEDEDEAEELARLEAPPARDSLLRAAVLRGSAVSPRSTGDPRAWVVQRGDLHAVSLQDGRSTKVQDEVVPPGATCQGLHFASRAGFVCQMPDGDTQVVVIERERWNVLARLTGPRAVLSAGGSGVVVEGPCRGSLAPFPGEASRVRGVCRIDRDGTHEHVAPAKTALPVATRAGVSWLDPPRTPGSEERSESTEADGAPADPKGGSLTDARGRSRPLRLPKDPDLLALLRAGQWLAGGRVADDGRLSFWVVGSEEFVGVRIDADGQVELGAVQKPVRRALLSGQYGFLWGAAGFAKETVDGGLSWQETSLPYRTGDADPTQPSDARTLVQAGCSSLGCVLGPWIRVGWNAGAEDGEKDAPQPATRLPLPSEVGRWRLQCRTSPRSSEAFVDERGRSALSRMRADLASAGADSPAGWEPFWEWRPSGLSRDEAGYSLGSHLERARLYAWGPKEAGWGERGRVRVAFVNPFSVDPVVVTPPGRAPWSDGRRAGVTFGSDGQSGASHLYVALDPSYEGGLALLRSSSETVLFVFEKDRGPTAVRGSAVSGLNGLEDAVKVGDSWFTVQRVGTSVRLLRVRGGQLEELDAWSLGRGEAPWIRLVRSVGGRQLALWVEGGAGRVVYPVDPESGALRDGVHVPSLGREPRLCPEGVEGYLLTMELSPSPQVSISGTQHLVEVARVTGQLVVGGFEPCVLQLSASTRDPVQVTAPQRTLERDTLTLTVTEQRPGGRRWEMDCR